MYSTWRQWSSVSRQLTVVSFSSNQSLYLFWRAQLSPLQLGRSVHRDHPSGDLQSHRWCFQQGSWHLVYKDVSLFSLWQFGNVSSSYALNSLVLMFLFKHYRNFTSQQSMVREAGSCSSSLCEPDVMPVIMPMTNTNDQSMGVSMLTWNWASVRRVCWWWPVVSQHRE